MARKVNTDRLGTAAPKVTQDDLEDDVAVVTVATYEEGEVDDAEKEGGVRAVAYLTFAELGDKRLYLNKTQAEALVTRYGDDADRWIGQPVPIEKTSKKFGTKTFHKVEVVNDPDEWDEYMPAAPARRRRAAGQKKAKARNGRKGRRRSA